MQVFNGWNYDEPKRTPLAGYFIENPKLVEGLMGKRYNVHFNNSYSKVEFSKEQTMDLLKKFRKNPTIALELFKYIEETDVTTLKKNEISGVVVQLLKICFDSARKVNKTTLKKIFESSQKVTNCFGDVETKYGLVELMRKLDASKKDS